MRVCASASSVGKRTMTMMIQASAKAAVSAKHLLHAEAENGGLHIMVMGRP